MSVVFVQPKIQVGGTLVRMSVSPLAQHSLNEALCIAVGTWRIGTVALVAQPEPPPQMGEAALAHAVVSEDPDKGVRPTAHGRNTRP